MKGTRFSLSEREKNTQKLCSSCVHLIDGECDMLINHDGALYRLARFSISGGECQLYQRAGLFFNFPEWFDPETDYQFIIQPRGEKK